MKATKKTAEYYRWGENCEGWYLLKTPALSVIQEKMPPGTTETLHFHQKAQQLFYVLSGTATFELEGSIVEIKAGEAFYIEPIQKHKISNKGEKELHFLVISAPESHGDRINVNL